MERAETTDRQLHVTLYTKVGCPLCEEARDLLDEIAATQPFEYTEIDIRTDMTTYETYRYRVPLVLINESLVAEGRIEYEDLAEAFRIG